MWTAGLQTAADWIAAGDMNGDGKDDLLGTWAGQGVYFRDTATGTWHQMSSSASQITCGDLDGDGTDDLVGIWAGQGGVWVKYSSDSSWEQLSSTADWITCGKMRDGGTTTALNSLLIPPGGIAEIPFVSDPDNDTSAKGPGGFQFVFTKQPNLFPLFNRNSKYSPGPGEPGFEYVEQPNLSPRKMPKRVVRK